jgi:hypothetical protein
MFLSGYKRIFFLRWLKYIACFCFKFRFTGKRNAKKISKKNRSHEKGDKKMHDVIFFTCNKQYFIYGSMFYVFVLCFVSPVKETPKKNQKQKTENNRSFGTLTKLCCPYSTLYYSSVLPTFLMSLRFFRLVSIFFQVSIFGNLLVSTTCVVPSTMLIRHVVLSAFFHDLTVKQALLIPVLPVKCSPTTCGQMFLHRCNGT